MHSIYQRINGISALLSSCLLALLAAIALSSLAIQATRPSAAASLSAVSLKVYKEQAERFRGKRQELAFYTFDYEADLTPLFDWNTKQIFLYLSAEYTNAQGVKNDVVLWDRIVRRKRDAKIKIKGVKNKYRFRELSTSFSNVSPANFTLKYNLMPYVGVLTYGEAGRTPNAIPFPPAETSVKP
ncbi:signal peptidase 22kDa subunit [Gautieria morchelliformis]|nr:signal peptidase 22kDa subunit [Gautieria morchelliformis]